MRKALTIVLFGILIVMISANLISFYRMMGTVADLSKMPIIAFLSRAASNETAQASPSIRIGFDSFRSGLDVGHQKVNYQFPEMESAVISNIDAFSLNENGRVTLRGWSITKNPDDYIQYIGVTNQNKLIKGEVPNEERKDVEHAFARTIAYAGFKFDFRSDPSLDQCQTGIFALTGHGDVSWLKRAGIGC